MVDEAGRFARDWWCRGGGAAVLALMAVVATFRRPTDPIFWAAAAFLAGHTAMAARRWSRERRQRTTATVTRHHSRVPEPSPPMRSAPARIPRLSLIQTKNTP
jgi:hypothetical protein